MEELYGHTLEYWKNNAEEDYLKVPISVLKYITCLEERIEQLTMPDVVESQFEAYAAFCIECDRQGMKPIKYKDYLEIG